MASAVVQVEARSTARQASCPGCGRWSGRKHGSCLRFPRDLPAAGTFVVVSLRVRRFVCAESSCPRKTFADRFRGSLAGSADAPSGCDRRWSPSVSRSRVGLAPR
ncbi:transposase family protein [Streptomyces fagopyri]